MTAATDTPLDRRQLRAYHKAIQDFLITVTNRDHVPYRLAANKVVLYPPDGSQPINVAARNTDRQMRSLAQWYDAHVKPTLPEEPPVDEAALQRLAETVNSPEHKVELRRPSVEKSVGTATVALEDVEESEQPAPTVQADGEWTPYLLFDGTPHEFIEQNADATQFRCRLCLGTEHEWYGTSKYGTGGHVRIRHRDTETFWKAARSQESIEKQQDSKKYNALRRQVEQIAEALDEALGREPKVDEKRVEALEAEVAKWRQRAEDAEARVALMREALRA